MGVDQRTKLKTIQLVSAVIIFAGIWGVLLPRIGRMTSVKEWIEPLRKQGINPSGLYYTDVFETPLKK